MTVINFDSLSIAETTQLWNVAFSDYLVPIKMSEADLKNRLTSLNLSSEYSKVITVNEHPAGIMLVGQQTFKNESQGWIGGMGVHPDFRRQGVASQLLKTAITSAKSLKVEHLLLEVIVGNDRAKALYRSFGFEELSQVTVAHLELSVKWENKMGIRLKKTVIENHHRENEKRLTPWQNRLTTPGLLQDIYLEGQRIGYLFYSENHGNEGVSSLTLKQFNCTNHSETLIESIFSELTSQYGMINSSLSNFDLAEELTQTLLTCGFVEQLQQHQLRLSI